MSTVAQPHAPRRPASSIAAVISVIGEGYSRPVIEGATSEVFDTLGLGHYPGTAMPGDEGNFAVAGHRQTNGAVLDHIDALTEGDRIHVRTADGYYTYLYSETLIVLPTQTDEIAPVPGEPGELADGGYMTLTSCNPRFGDTERIIVHAQLESWRPNFAGPPPRSPTSSSATPTDNETGELMYAWIFCRLAGPFAVKAMLTVLLIALVVLALMQYVFPWVQEEFSPLQGEITMDTSSSSQQ